MRSKDGIHRLIVLVFAAVAALSAVRSAEPRRLSLDDRIAAQRAIEQVYWNHRLWPKENPEPKPPLSAVMSDEAIRAKVEDYLKKSSALEKWWQRPVTAEQLQAELDRMAKNTRDGATLRELFAVLGNDPLVIAEMLARQSLVERLIRNWYSTDTRFHADAKAKSEAALAACSKPDCMKSMTGTYRETTWNRRDERQGTASDEGNAAFALDTQAWTEKLARLAMTLGGTAESLPTGRLSAVEESPEAFVLTAVLARREAGITVATVSWPKRSFEDWWGVARGAIEFRAEESRASFTLPETPLTSCTNDSWTPTRYEVPDPREQHAAVWTGTEMIIWGGSNDYYGNTGGRYNPSTDSWTSTSITNAPTARANMAAVWTGTEMIVWGGYAGAYLNSGGRYNPSTDSWAPTSSTNSPTARSSRAAVWTGTEMIVWGGYTGVYLNSGGRYNPSTDSWAPTSSTNAPTARWNTAAVWTGTEMIVWGGSGGTSVNTGGRYNPSSDSWTATSTGTNVPAARHEHTAVWTGSEMIVWGGSAGMRFNTGGRYNPSTDTWVPTSTQFGVAAARERHTVVWTGTQMIVWGGYDDSFSVNTGGVYAPATDSWMPTSTGANVPSARTGHTAVWTGAEMIVWGGSSNTGGRYNPSNNSWTATSTGTTVPAARGGDTAVWTGAEMIVWGGTSGAPLNSGGRYTPAIDSWAPTSTGTNVPDGRSSHSAVWTGTEMIVWGGSEGESPVNTGGRYYPSTNAWLATSTGMGVAAARHSHTAVWTGSRMIVWGGFDGSSEVNTGSRYAPVADSWLPTSTGTNVPTARSQHTAVWSGTQMIVWGGGGVNTGGRYNQSLDSWTPTSTGANVPTARLGHTAVWTGTEMIVWGGFFGGSLNTGGRYIPSTDSWSATSTGAGAPSSRRQHTAVWTGAEMIVWGGTSSGNTGARYNASTDTWTPTSTGTNAPTARYAHRAVWTGMEMIVWGGTPATTTGGRYCACQSGNVLYRDADMDGYGDPGVWITVCGGSMAAGYVGDSTDCDDANASIHPGASEACDGVDANCDPLLPINEADDDGDGIRVCSGDCNDGNPFTYPGAEEINDGADNQCPGWIGFGSIDEIGGTTGFLTPGNKTSLSWTAQPGATAYDVARSPYRDHHAGCLIFHRTVPNLTSPIVPLAGGVHYYLVRSATPWTGSWGKRTSGLERVVCAGCDSGADQCDDANVCTSGDDCSGSICVSGAALNCDDGDPCTDDSCNSASGCQHVNNTSSCDDGNVCTAGDVCSEGVCAGTFPAAANHLVISQVQVEGDGPSAMEDEFVEIYNPTSAPISLVGMTLQWKTNAGGAVYSRHLFQFGAVPAHGWFLVAGAGFNGSPVPNDFNDHFSLANVVGNLFLVGNAALLSGSCPVATTSIIDTVAYGTGACPEGGGGVGTGAPQPPPNDSIIRKPGGTCGNGIDTNNNAADFVLQSPATPRNAASPPQP